LDRYVLIREPVVFTCGVPTLSYDVMLTGSQLERLSYRLPPGRRNERVIDVKLHRMHRAAGRRRGRYLDWRVHTSFCARRRNRDRDGYNIDPLALFVSRSRAIPFLNDEPMLPSCNWNRGLNSGSSYLINELAINVDLHGSNWCGVNGLCRERDRRVKGRVGSGRKDRYSRTRRSDGKAVIREISTGIRTFY